MIMEQAAIALLTLLPRVNPLAVEMRGVGCQLWPRDFWMARAAAQVGQGAEVRQEGDELIFMALSGVEHRVKLNQQPVTETELDAVGESRSRSAPRATGPITFCAASAPAD